MPFGSTGSFTDKEWANGVSPAPGLGDVPRARCRPTRSTRATARSARPTGARSPGSPRAATAPSTSASTIRRSSACSRAGPATSARTRFGSVFGDTRRAAPAEQPALPAAARRAARCFATHTYIWFYSGTDDQPAAAERARSRRTLDAPRLPHRFFVVRGGHNWALWRGNAARACSQSSRPEAHVLRRVAALPVLLGVGLRGDGLALPRPAALPGPRIGDALPLDELPKHARCAAPLVPRRLVGRGPRGRPVRALGAARAADRRAPARPGGRRPELPADRRLDSPSCGRSRCAPRSTSPRGRSPSTCRPRSSRSPRRHCATPRHRAAPRSGHRRGGRRAAARC